MAVRTELTLAATLHTLGLLGGTTLPRFVTDVGGRGDVLEVITDARAVKDLPGPLKLATRLVPVVRSKLRVEQFDARIALDVQRLVEARRPESVVTDMTFRDGLVALETAG